MHRVIKKALATFERESKLPSDEKRGAWSWLEAFGRVCLQQAGGEIISLLEVMPKDRLLATIGSWVKWKFNRRGNLSKKTTKEDSHYEYSLGAGNNCCPLCVYISLKMNMVHGPASAALAVSVGGCRGCPIKIIYYTCTSEISPYKEASGAGRKTTLVNALWEAVEWAVKHEGDNSAVE